MRFDRERIPFLPGLCLKTAGRCERSHVYIYLVIVLKVLAAMAILGWLVATLAQPQREVWSVGPSAWLRGASLPRPKGTPASLTFVAGDHLYAIGGTWSRFREMR
jgi:hypothetical protein